MWPIYGPSECDTSKKGVLGKNLPIGIKEQKRILSVLAWALGKNNKKIIPENS